MNKKEEIKEILGNMTTSDNTSKKAKDSFSTYTKRIVSLILIFCAICMILTYILAFMGRDQIAESLSTTIAQTILGTILGYMLKSYNESKQIENNTFKKAELIANIDDFDDDAESPMYTEEILRNLDRVDLEEIALNLGAEFDESTSDDELIGLIIDMQ